MGMRDQSWCGSCGTGLPYSDKDYVECGECAQESPDKLIELIEYMKIHLISLMQDLEQLENQMELLDMNSKDYVELDFEFNIVSGQITATRHLMSVANDILAKTKEN